MHHKPFRAEPTPLFTRRALLRFAGASALALPFTPLLGCDGGGAEHPDGGTSGTDGASDDSSTWMWATGGTAAMVDSASYPNPFAGSSPTTCEVTCGATIGPCHTTSPERADVSDGWDGLPVRLALRVLDETCTPVEDAIVEIWHTNYRGIYSGEISTMCNTDAADRAAGYFRGYLRTDADGRVDFDTVFPGWYSGRAVHIHFRVMMGTYDGSDSATASVVSQLFFSDALVDEIFTAQPLYEAFGTPDTLLGTDNVVGGEADPSPYVCDVARASDGAMLASKTIILRTSSASCTIAGASGGMLPAF